MRWPWTKQKNETRSASSGFTAEIMAARESYISGRRGIGELTATAQSCISLWEGGLSLADVSGTDYLRPRDLAILARSLGLRGEAVFLIASDRLLPASDWDLKTQDGVPTAYRLSISEAGGGRTMTALAPEVLHIAIGADTAAPFYGQPPLRRAAITAGLLNALEEALRETFENSPLGSKIVPFPESPDTDNEQLSRGFRGKRGRMLLRESVNVAAAGGPAPQSDWRPSDLSPDLASAMTSETLAAARDAICGVYGVLPSLMNPAATGPLVREAQRHLASWMLQPIAELIAEEASLKLGGNVEIDVLRPLQAFDAGGRARAFAGVIDGLAAAKAAGLTPEQVKGALEFIDLTPADY
ncbi:phage portal protein [Hyphococcus sp.]|uniref:phage portal protein n=1 Tax=Hyphococcus sp. TaxID=2038636 RepID=UPI002083470B|nr:MAG: hypothetical protein DHS20C04_30510 [Marinicaulis sp.]